jgi:DnaJ-class molecular chaperone
MPKAQHELVCSECDGHGWVDVGTRWNERRKDCEVCNGVGVRAIHVKFVFPPLPDRTSDWQATFEGDEEGPAGWGRTELDAVADLKENNYFD